MEPKTNDPRGTEYSDGAFGRGLQFMIQAPLFVIVGVLVVVWETVNRLFRTIYNQGAQYTSTFRSSAQAPAAPTGVKVPVLPIDNYGRMDVDEIIGRLNGLSLAELAIVRNFESNHEKRTTILEAIDKRMDEVH